MIHTGVAAADAAFGEHSGTDDDGGVILILLKMMMIIIIFMTPAGIMILNLASV